MDRARGLIDLDWSQRNPIFHPGDIDQDPRFNQYPYPDDDLDYDDEEEMETDYQNAPHGGAGDARIATRPVLGVVATTHQQLIQCMHPKVKLRGHPGALTQTHIRQWKWVV